MFPDRAKGQCLPKFLTHPVVEIQKFRGQAVSAYVKLQDRKAVRDTQPNPKLAVFFHVDELGRPVAVSIFTPVEGYVVAGLLFEFLVGEDGSPSAVGQRVHCGFIPVEEMKTFLHAANEANEKLTEQARGGEGVDGRNR